MIRIAVLTHLEKETRPEDALAELDYDQHIKYARKHTL